MRIALAADHAGFHLKEQVRGWLTDSGHQVVDLGTESEQPVDYPLVAAPAAQLVATGEANFGVLVCGSGVGVTIVANKVAGVRAVNAHSSDEAAMARRHNDANVLALAGGKLQPQQAAAIVETFLTTACEGGRHQRRVEQITALEGRDDRAA